MLLGDACAVLGKERVWRGAQAALRRRQMPSTSVTAAVIERLQAVAAAPFTAVITTAWSNDFEDFFPHRVGMNFGGFAAVLMKPRIDAKPGRSRPVLQLWPGLLSR